MADNGSRHPSPPVSSSPPPPPPTSSSNSFAASSARPTTISLPPRSFNETLFTSGLGVGFSPGPMTLVSSFFSDSDDFKSFSQLLAGAMVSPAANSNNKPPFPPLPPEDKSKTSVADVSRPTSLSISPPSPMFTVPPGLSPMALLDSPAFGLLSPQGHIGMTHQQALAQVTAQAAQAHSNMHIQAHYSSSLPSAPETSSTQFSSVTTNSTTDQKMLSSIPDPSASINESSDFSHSDQRSQASSLVVDKPTDDGYNWRKYGQKQVKGSEFPRSYYKCTHPNCPVKKKVERSLDGQVTEIIYKGQHNHQAPQPNKRAKGAGSLNGNSNNQNNFELASQFQSGNVNKLKDRKDQESSQATHELLSGASDSEEDGDAENGVDGNDEDEPDPKRRNTEVKVTDPASSHRTVTESRIIVQTTSEVDLLDDGYRWRKYGQKVVKGNPYPRSYYKCTTAGCKVRKHIERAATDPRAVITTYEGKHNHDVPATKGSSHSTANSHWFDQGPWHQLPYSQEKKIKRSQSGDNFHGLS
ncbi:probable WRKY transcription factor 3 isoform X2 [Hevea brasiliensis]|uniref:probable WRKY transcription factor 3 isoform X2 n=1 Tax=Hevea brasiliensis TaxID=3981 RepID=UPI0025F3B3FA|nr:probable WRKY transcription factor 3 isoform X2 [Hevea brasiliensis]